MGTKDKTTNCIFPEFSPEFLSVCLGLDLWLVLVNLVSFNWTGLY